MCNHLSLGLSKSHSLTYLISKLGSSNIVCVCVCVCVWGGGGEGGVHSVYNGLIISTLQTKIATFVNSVDPDEAAPKAPSLSATLLLVSD